jgi:hypothetical protein
MVAHLQVGPVNRIGGILHGPSGYGFNLTASSQLVATIFYQTRAEAEVARNTIEQALTVVLASAIAVTTPP